ncbi:MAG: hypothetical protein A3J38_04730 [Gammaproteobacteria bacterium RIFCSPHIGHO2_12_FULL_45_9]|nr:MAG: hypothetical protein A3J38_04730 [Gammaproteobacteria bacterium RIFCSPHIGHO2_12_FULL_45_9]
MRNIKKKWMRWAWVFIGGITVALLWVWLFNSGSGPTYPLPSDLKMSGTVLPFPKHIAWSGMHTTDGQRFKVAQLKGHWTLVFFGFTNCGYVCPTTLSTLNQFYQVIQKKLPAPLWPQVVMVSVDPERDTSARLSSYVSTFNPAFKGVVGSMHDTHALADQVGIAFSKIHMKGRSGYMVDHSAEILVFDPNGAWRAEWAYPHQTATMVADYQRMMLATGQWHA